MDSLGSIVLEKNSSNPLLVIATCGVALRTLRLVPDVDKINSKDYNTVRLHDEDIIMEKNDGGLQLSNYVFDYENVVTVNSLDTERIASLTEKAYLKTLRSYTSYQASIGAKNPTYLAVRSEVHNQLIEMMFNSGKKI